MSTLEIRPVPTQRQRKALKGLPQVKYVIVDGDRAWVDHSAWVGKERYVADSIAELGFEVKGYNWQDDASGMRRAKKDKLAKKKMKKRQRKARRGP